MSRKQHKTSPIDFREFLSDVDSTFVVARRKGGRVRYQNTITAVMGKWVPAPANSMKARAAALNKAAAKIDAQQREAVTAAAYESMTVPVLFKEARAKFGMRVTTKTRKAELVRMLTSLAVEGM